MDKASHPMPIYLTPTALSNLTLFIFAGLIAGYLAVLARKSQEPRRQIITLALTLTFVSGFALTTALIEAIYPVARYWVQPVNNVMVSLVLVCWAQFAYQLPAHYPRPVWARIRGRKRGRIRMDESRLILGLTLLLLLYEIVLAVQMYASLAERVYSRHPQIANLLWAATPLYILGVFIRQTGRADGSDRSIWVKLRRPANRHSRAARNFALVSLIFVGSGALTILHQWALINITAVRSVTSLGVLLTLLVITLAYLNYRPEQTSFQVRLVAITLAFFLGVLSVVGQVTTPAFSAAYHDTRRLNLPQTLQFSPNAQGGYDIHAHSNQYQNELGEPFLFEGETTLIACDCLPLEFEFPFYGRSWAEVHITRRGIVTFDGPPDPTFGAEIPAFDRPAIYLTGSDTWAAGGIETYAWSTPTGLALTWLKNPQPGDTHTPGAFQLHLYPTGVFELTFAALPPVQAYEVQYGWQANQLLGAVPGTSATPEQVHFNRDLPISGGAAGVIETYDLNYRATLHHYLTPLFWLTLVSTGLVIGGLPLALRGNLIKPLKSLLTGVHKMKHGDLSTQVPVIYADEFGYLTQAFNAMTVDMNALVTDLETRVAERTVELADTAAYLDNILRSATDYAITTVDDQFQIVYLNPLAEKVYGISAAEVLGKTITDVFAAVPGLAGIQDGLRRAEKHDTQPGLPGGYKYAYIQETPAGPRHITARFSSVRNQQGAVIGYAHFARDITERVQTETQLLNQQRTLSALEERERIGRELHDGIGQVMGYLNLQMQASQALIAAGKAQGADKLIEQLIGVTQTAHNDVREFILGMNQSDLAATDFWTALDRLSQNFEAERGLSVRLSLPAEKPPWLIPPDDLHLLLIRVYAELAAAVRHRWVCELTNPQMVRKMLV